MKRSVAIILACLATYGCGARAPGPTMHQVRAGTPDKSGWITAESTYGRFSVKVPAPFNDFTVEDADAASPMKKAEAVGCTTAEGIKFSAAKCFYKSPFGAAAQWEKMKGGRGMGLATVVPSRVNGHEALDFGDGRLLADAPTNGRSRAVLVGGELYLLTVEWPVEREALAKPLVPTFLDSLALLQ